MLAGRPSRHQAIADMALGVDHEDEEIRERPTLKLTPAREDALELWKSDIWALLTGKDPDTGVPIVWTVDQRDRKNPFKPFPAHLDYVHYLVDLLRDEPYLMIEKCSQMFVTTTIALDTMACTLTEPAFKTLLSKHKEDEAVTILREKIMAPWERMPDWLKHYWPLRNKPSNRVECRVTGSHILGLPENAAAADARGQTYQRGLIDEAEYQEMLPDLLSAMLPRAGQVVWWSTPAEGGAGVTTVKSYLADHGIKNIARLVALKKKYVHVKGMTTRRNEDRNVTICRIEHRADPAKNSQKWLDETARPMSDNMRFRREILIDRSSNAGRPFHPQFLQWKGRFLMRCPPIPKVEPIVRGWDFGGANPACIWGVWSRKSKRFFVVRELLGFNIDTYQFCDLVKFLSGQISLEALSGHTRALQMLEELKWNRAYYDEAQGLVFPWFTGSYKWLDFAGNEGLIGPRGLAKSGEAKTAAEILHDRDVILYSRQLLHSKRTEVINGLSRLREDGHPGILIDPSCQQLWTGLTTGLVFAKATPQNPDPSEVAPHAIFSHLYDALGYAVCNMVEIQDAEGLKMTIGPDGRFHMPDGPDTQIASYLVGA